jgi:hypothetical protein
MEKILIENNNQIKSVKYSENIENLEISNCKNLENIYQIQGLKKLSISECPKLTEIPSFPFLKYLQIANKISKEFKVECINKTNFPLLEYLECPELHISKIDNFPNLKHLIVHYCKELREIPVIPGLKELVFFGSKDQDFEISQQSWSSKELRSEISQQSWSLNEVEIPFIESLEWLVCPFSIKTIPILPNLKVLNCRNCKELENLPIINSIEELYLYDNNKMKEIPFYPNLKILSCCYCENLEYIPLFPKLEKARLDGCKNLIFAPQINKNGVPTGQPFNYVLNCIVA